MPAKRKNSRKKRKKESSSLSKAKEERSLWIGQGHLYSPQDESVRKDL